MWLIEATHAGDGPIPYPANHGYPPPQTLLLEEHLVDGFRLPSVDVDGQLAHRVDRRTACD